MISRWSALAFYTLAASAIADVQQAQLQIEAGDLEAAQVTLEAHLGSDPDDRSARFLLARVVAWQGEPARSIVILEQLLDDSPNNADYLLALGQAQLWDGRVHAAVATLERAASIAEDYPDVDNALRQARMAIVTPNERITLPRQEVDRRHQLEFSVRHDWLDNDSSDWRRQRLDYFASQRDGVAWYGALLREQRFEEWDEGFEAGAVVALDPLWNLQSEIGYQFSPFFSPRWYADLRLQRSLPQGFLAAASVRRTDYATSQVDRLALSAERYWNNWRGGYTLNISDVSNAGTPIGHSASLDYYYSGLSYFGLRVTLGEEEAVEGSQLFTSSVRAVGLQGRHWVSARWALSWEFGTVKQGDYYTRRGAQIGIRHAF